VARAPANRGEVELLDGRIGIGEQPLSEPRVYPGTGHDFGAVVRTDPGLVGLNNDIQGFRIDQAFVDQQRFERAHP